MAALPNALPLVIFMVFLSSNWVCLADEASPPAEIKYPRLVVEPDLKDQTRILNIGDQLSFTCRFEAGLNDKHSKAEELKWTDEWGTVIGTDSQAREYTKALSGKSRRMLLLTINAKNEFGAFGPKTFICEATTTSAEGTQIQLKKEIRVKAVGAPTWKSDETEVIGRLDELLSIDCSPVPAAQGTHVDTVIMFQNNTELPKYYEISGARLTIPKLSMAERNVVIKCTAIETHTEEDIVLTAERLVKVNLQYPPSFAHDHMKRYGIVGRKLTLPCRVTDSNPRVTSFDFYADNKPLKDDGVKYTEDPNIDEQVSTLTILNLEDSDFEYKIYGCRVRAEDNAFEREMTYSLQKAFPPEKPQVAFKRSGRDEIVFEVKEVVAMVSADNPPVTQFEIRLVNHNDVKDLEETERRRKLDESRPRTFNKTDSNIYTVDHLHWKTLYTFDIRALNEAGNSEAFVYNATTLEETSSAESSSISSMLVVITSIVCTLLLTMGWRQY